MKIDDFAGTGPALRLETYFAGCTTAWGIFEDRFGTLRRMFTADMLGYVEGPHFILDERFDYSDGEQERRIWRISVLPDGYYRGEAAGIIGIGQGRAVGRAMNWRYQVDLPIKGRSWRVRFDDWMFMSDAQTVVNRAKVYKWGCFIGAASIFFRKPAASEMPVSCSPTDIGSF